MYFQVTYKDDKQSYDDYVLEQPSKKDAEEYAKHRADKTYYDTTLEFVKVKRISREVAKEMLDANAVAWCDPIY